MKWVKKINFPTILLLLIYLVSQYLLFFPSAAFSKNKNSYQVIVVGGEPEGIAAALSAARNGAKTLLISEDKVLGGTMTLANLTNIDMNYGPSRQLLTKGIFAEFLHWVKGDSFDVKEAKKAFNSLISREKNIATLLGTKVEKPLFAPDGKTLVGLQLIHGKEKFKVYGKRFIDATADGDLAALSGVPYTIGKEDMGLAQRVMAPTLVFQVGGVNWRRITSHLQNDHLHLSGANNFSAWGYNKEMKGYKPLGREVKVRALNIGRQDDGSVMINALLLFGVNPLDSSSLQKAMLRGEREAKRIVPYLKEHILGFENAYLIGVASKLYVRESRHIKGEYQLTIDDVLENRNFPDKIALGSYPVDVQASTKGESGFIIGVPKIYSIPFRSLVPLKVENLLVVGRSAAYTSLAAGSARVIPVGMVEGQSAGLAAVYSLNKHISFRQLSRNLSEIRKVQATLRSQGAYLPEFYIAQSREHREWTYPYMAALRRKGLVVSDYKNSYSLNEPIKPVSFITLVQKTIENLPQKVGTKALKKEIAKQTGEPITYIRAKEVLETARKNYLELIKVKYDVALYIPKVMQLKIFNRQKLDGEKVLTRGEAFALIYQFNEQIRKDLT